MQFQRHIKTKNTEQESFRKLVAPIIVEIRLILDSNSTCSGKIQKTIDLFMSNKFMVISGLVHLRLLEISTNVEIKQLSWNKLQTPLSGNLSLIYKRVTILLSEFWSLDSNLKTLKCEHSKT